MKSVVGSRVYTVIMIWATSFMSQFLILLHYAAPVAVVHVYSSQIYHKSMTLLSIQFMHSVVTVKNAACHSSLCLATSVMRWNHCWRNSIHEELMNGLYALRCKVCVAF